LKKSSRPKTLRDSELALRRSRVFES
jgi:hypothetical protein